MKKENLKHAVQEKYSQIARNSNLSHQANCCGSSGCCGGVKISMIGDEYKNINGYVKEADLGLGCGIPTEFAEIKIGDYVLDLGCGAGNDCFIARSLVGETGKVIGIDFTDAMIKKAIENNRKLGYKNVEFIKGDIENLPLPDNTYDVVISNCVLNLVPDKNKAFSEIYRVLKPYGHFCISDVVIQGILPEALRNDMEMYAGCIAGALELNEYIAIIEKLQFKNITIHKQKEITIPHVILHKYLSNEELESFLNTKTGIYSITISGFKMQ